MKNILIIGGGVLMIPTVKVALDMGLKVTVVDQNPQAPAVSLADDFLEASTYDPEAVIDELKRNEYLRRYSGVFTAGGDVEITVAVVAKFLGLPGVSPEVALRCNDKSLMKELLTKAGVATPLSILTGDIVAARAAVDKAGLPAVVKPLNNCGSRGVSKIAAAEELDAAFLLAMEHSPDDKVLVESFLQGTTHTVEMIAYKGHCHVASVIDTVHGYEPYFVELYHVNPTRRTEEEKERMVTLAKDAARAVGIDEGVAKVDIIYSENGPEVMEMTCRLSGGFHSQYTTPLALGTNNIRAALTISLGEEPDMKDIDPQKNECAISSAVFPEPGVIETISGVIDAKEISGIEEIFILKGEGEEIGPYRASADRGIYIIAHKPTEEETWSAIREAEKLLTIKTRPI